jgi:hypothetical protein
LLLTNLDAHRRSISGAGASLRIPLIASLLLLCVSDTAGADSIKAPKISIAAVEWDAARAALIDTEAMRRLSASAHAAIHAPDPLTQLNRRTGATFPNIAASPVPVLLPFDLDAFLRHKADEESDYLAGFGAPKFFQSGPAGYSAAFSVTLPESETRSKPRDVEIHLSGFALLYELGERVGGEEKPLAGLQADFPGMRRLYLESHMRYLFSRFGVLYEVSVECFDGVVRRSRLSCQDAHGVATRFLKALAIAGGTPQTIAAEPPALRSRPEQPANAFSYYPPGRLIAGTDSRQRGGDADNTVYAPIRFPLMDGPVHTYSQMFINLGDCTAALGDSRTLRRNGKPFRCLPGTMVSTAEMPRGGQNRYPWRDNFCERRGFFVGQCPSGLGHQGQDIVPVGCALSGRDDGGCDRRHHQVVAVHDGMLLRQPRQEGLAIVANAPGTHVRFRYLHMNPKAIDADGFFSGRAVREGDVLGKVSNFNGREGGTSYHLHFDMQVPTKDGWVLANPYMTLVTAYERLIGGRGAEIDEEAPQASVPVNVTELAGIPPEYQPPAKKIRKPAQKKRLATRNKQKK